MARSGSRRKRPGRRQPLARIAFFPYSGQRPGARMVTSGDWADVRRILCVRLDNMGDVLMTTPALRALKRQRPGRRLTLLASPSGAALAPHLEDVDEVMAYRVPWVKHADRT